MRRICFYHAGCPDGLGAAWAVRHCWGDAAEYRPRGHDDTVDLDDLDGCQVVYVDFAPPNDELIVLAETAAQIIVLDHHLSARDRIEADPAVANALAGRGHQVVLDLTHSGAVLTWLHFSPDEPVPELLRYVEDQDLWTWELPNSEEINAAIGSFPLEFETWDELSRRSPDELASEGRPLVRANRTQVARALRTASRVLLDGEWVEAVNATSNRSAIGHELAKRAAFGRKWGCVFHMTGHQVSATLYSIGDEDVSAVATRFGGGGHRNAAGFSVSLRDWLELSQ